MRTAEALLARFDTLPRCHQRHPDIATLSSKVGTIPRPEALLRRR
jgi:hypothetical protein